MKMRITLFILLTIAGAASLQLRPIGQPQLMSIAPIVESGGDLCESMPAAANFAQQDSKALRDIPSDQSRKVEVAKREPMRKIHDPYAGYSAIAVDAVNNEVVITDETLFRVLAYDRLANTPPTATMTEPKRIIGGVKTQMEFQCGLYIDPNNGDIYAINGDTVEKAVIFSRKAKGDVAPDRTFVTPHGTAGIVVDEARQDL